MTSDTTGGERAYHHGDLRRALLAAAEAELIEKGMEGFSLRGCAKRAGVSHAAPAHHFKDAAGLLAALATEGFERFLATMARRRAALPEAEPSELLVASGLGYIAFALENPALFRLMFSSQRPDFDDAELTRAALAAFTDLVDAISAVRGEPALESVGGMRDVAATWAVAHGLADLVLSKRMGFIAALAPSEREAHFAAIIARVASRPAD